MADDVHSFTTDGPAVIACGDEAGVVSIVPSAVTCAACRILAYLRTVPALWCCAFEIVDPAGLDLPIANVTAACEGLANRGLVARMAAPGILPQYRAEGAARPA